MKRILSTLLAVGLLAVLAVGFSGCSTGTLCVLDSEGALLAELTSQELSEQSIYIRLAVEDAVKLLAESKGWDTAKAQKKLWSGNYTVCTAYVPQVQQAVEQMAAGYAGVNVACAVTDLEGHLVAVAGEYATMKLAPYSSFKPLAVYGPALEKGLIHYSTSYLDGPVKQMTDETGQTSDWPANATGTYRNKDVSVADAIRESLNTVAVRCMQDLGVTQSLAFMKERFGLELPFEENRLASLGEEEIFGNVALGFLTDGVTPVEMAGYYQCFATLGKYTQPSTVTALLDQKGETVCAYEPEAQQALSETTADLMNRLLQNVTSPAGTGAAAGNAQFPVAGKTGTGAGGNWFIGVTPEYSCAVWHGKELTSNTAAKMFKEAVTAFPSEGLKNFPKSEGIVERIFCTESGKVITENCTRIQLGYFTGDTIPDKCDLHP